jgi:hypothetical protein
VSDCVLHIWTVCGLQRSHLPRITAEVANLLLCLVTSLDRRTDKRTAGFSVGRLAALNSHLDDLSLLFAALQCVKKPS